MGNGVQLGVGCEKRYKIILSHVIRHSTSGGDGNSVLCNLLTAMKIPDYVSRVGILSFEPHVVGQMFEYHQVFPISDVTGC